MKEINAEQEGAPAPTKAELDILQVLWAQGPATVRFVNDTLNDQKKSVQYTSTLKQMQVMAEKGLLLRDESSMKHIYTAAIEEGATKGLLLDRFVDTMYKGSATSLLQQLLGNKKTSKAELDAIRALLDNLDTDTAP
jgi:BlaI family transcriptional regulator, penicillinase repressor